MHVEAEGFEVAVDSGPGGWWSAAAGTRNPAMIGAKTCSRRVSMATTVRAVGGSTW